jgi:hypothetical protein
VYFVQRMLGSRLRKQLLNALYKSAVLHQIWVRIRRVSAPLVSNRRPFSQRRRCVEIDLDICSGHGARCDCVPYVKDKAPDMAAQSVTGPALARPEPGATTVAFAVWHLSDIAICPPLVRFRGHSRSRTTGPSGQLLTRNGHRFAASRADWLPFSRSPPVAKC